MHSNEPPSLHCDCTNVNAYQTRCLHLFLTFCKTCGNLHAWYTGRCEYATGGRGTNVQLHSIIIVSSCVISDHVVQGHFCWSASARRNLPSSSDVRCLTLLPQPAMPCLSMQPTMTAMVKQNLVSCSYTRK